MFQVRVSRWLLLLLVAVGALFFAAGLDILLLHVVFDPSIGADRPVLRLGFAVFALAVGLVLVLTQGFYLIFPPVMLRISGDNVSFGTGLSYRPKSIPLQYLRSANIYQQASMLEVLGKRRTVDAGVELQFERRPEIPASAITSAGLSYSDYSLCLFKTYMNRPLPQTVEAVRRLIKPGSRRRL